MTNEIEYEFHEIANLFPLMDKDGLNELKKDIEKNGLLESIVIYENKILDGRNRYLACKELGINFFIKHLPKGIEPLAYVIAENLNRRHLTSAQKAEVGLKILEREKDLAKKRMIEGKKIEDTPMSSEDIGSNLKKKISPKKGSAREITAKRLNISQETLITAKKVKELNDPHINKKWEKAKKGTSTIKAVKMAIDKKTKPKIIPKLPTEKYNVIYADPPWEYNFTEAPNRSIEKEYPTMTLKELCKLKIPSADDCILLLWCTSPKLYPEGNEILKAWGFTYKTSMVWIKDKIGMGYYARQRHELLLIATKGNIGVPDPENRFDSIIEAPRQEHSKKPEEVYDRIEKMYPQGKYLELFARNKREKWTSWGNEIEH